MKPTHLSIRGRSKPLFLRSVVPRLIDQPFSGLIARVVTIPHAQVVFTEQVLHEGDLAPLVRFLEKSGIQSKDLHIHYERQSGSEALRTSMAQGLEAAGIGFGQDVAERDAGLSRYFVQTSAFQRIRNNAKHIVIGPKGSGKSAILRELARDNNHTLVITPEHYATDVLKTLSTTFYLTELAPFVATWKYTLLIEIFRSLVTNKIGDATSIIALRKFLLERGHMTSNLTLFERFLRYLRRIGRIKGKVGPAEAEISIDADSSEELGKLFKMDELLDLVPVLQRALRREPFSVYIDDLDQSWDNSKVANNFLVSLLTAAIQLRGLHENLHVVVFLRTEIYELLKPHLGQLDKLRADTEVLQWRAPELVRLIASRIIDSLQIQDNVAAEEVVRLLFGDQVGDSDAPGFDYIVSRTSSRPREVIQFCNLALQKAINLGHNRISADAILRAEEEFSAWKVEHIVSENMYVYPGLDVVIEYFRHKPRMILHEALDAVLTELLLESEGDSESPGWLRRFAEPENLMNLLFSLEVIGIENPSKVSHPRMLWTAYDFAYERPRARADRAQSYLFHPGLWRSMELL
jgi:hypothetical protein